ncbi:MAG TPA: aldehyde dehydrogenase family protein, partial [Gemmatimonadales bacterium]|nr:aldehyde dehydrogenase family protein [Gemmatimonadales bacterium]
MPIISINPTTGSAIQAYDEMTPSLVATAIEDAADAWRDWRATSFAERAELLRVTAGILRERKDELARLMALEMGKPVKQGV